ncbi:MAG: ABC transporter substrate-binding protein [Chloroflexota bacterium]
MRFTSLMPGALGVALLLSSCAPAATPAAAPASSAPQPAVATPAPGATAPAAPKPAATQPRRGGTLRIMTAGEPALWDPHQATSRNNEVWSFVTNTLVYVSDQTQEVQPVLATEWKYIDDKTLVVSLQRGVKFHNKSPVNSREMTATDVIYSLTRIRTGKPAPRSGQFAPVSEIKALDDYTIQVSLKEPFAPLVSYLGDSMNVIVPKEAIEKSGDFNRPEDAVGTGPFIMTSYTPDVGGKMLRNASYFVPGRPYVDSVEIIAVKDRAAMMGLYRTGNLDLGTGSRGALTGEEKANLQRTNPDIILVPQPTAYVYQLLLNLKKEPFTDVRVRKAFHLAIDRTATLQAVVGGSGDISGPLSPRLFPQVAIPTQQLLTMPGYRNPKDQDIAEAKRLLTEAGYPNGLAIKGEGTERVGILNLLPLEAAVSQLAKINVKMQIDVMDDTPFRKMEEDRTFLIRARGHAVSIEPDDILYTLYHTKGARNYGSFSDPEVDKLIEAQRRTLDATKRKEILLQAQQRILELVPRIAMFSGNDFAVVQPWLHNVEPGPRNYFGRTDVVWLGR